ncbi:WecB/TagA/CpsF family glycosyltransferase [Clostridium lundense]|uniref:WecB/TagA/CpsF family glycosyltransferase n=1 Tax=Clostridium lundense TaxID=319475 RepID=UPI000483B253|nr:WecB/TagA/CpsF family glycosyltransferase [Clostridium lundense]
MFTNILGYNIFKEDKRELLNYIKTFNKLHIISGNPEVLSNGLNNEKLLKNFKSENSIIIPDGVGTVIASKIVGNPVKEKLAGIEIMEEIIKLCEREGKGIYLLGTKEEILNKCAHNLKLKYPKLKILGKHNGFFDLKNCDEIINEINELNPYALFVAMGSPRQEIFISEYMNILNPTVFMGVGGSLDIFSGEMKRAPKWMINIGFEWLYRVSKEPWRIKRLSSIPKFLVKVIQNK